MMTTMMTNDDGDDDDDDDNDGEEEDDHGEERGWRRGEGGREWQDYGNESLKYTSWKTGFI